jgi:hypothetical protein
VAIVHDAHTAAGISTSANPIATPQTFSHTVGSGSDRLLAVTIKMRGGAGGVVTGVTFNGVAMTAVDTEAISGSAHAVIYYLKNPDTGTHTVSVAHSMTGSAHLEVSASSYTGVDQTNTLNAFSKAAASSAGPMSTAPTTTVDDCLIIDSCAMRTQAGETATMTAVTNRTQRTNVNTAAAGLRGLTSDLVPAGAAGSKTMEWTKTLNHDWAIMAAAFAPAAANNNISGSSSLAFSPSGTVLGQGAIGGSSALTFAPSGAITGKGAISGSSTLTFSPSASLSGKGALLGSTALTFSLIAATGGTTLISGSLSFVLGASGTLTNAGELWTGIPPSAATWNNAANNNGVWTVIPPSNATWN